MGGETAAEAKRADADGNRNDAAEKRTQAGLMGRQGGFDRRVDDAKLNASLALKDIQKGELDRAGAEVRIKIAELELELQKNRLEDAKALRTHLRDKFTSRQLQAWSASRFQQLLYQQYRIAYDLALQAKMALVREQGLEDQSPIADTWDSPRRGRGAAAGLLLELEKQQHLFVQVSRREQEKLKEYSLAQRQPLALLELLQRGETVINVTEADLDEDGAGDWYRRLRRVSVDVLGVRGPYTNTNARITQLRGEVRRKPFRATDATYYREAVDDSRFRDDVANGEFIVTNTGIQDDGRVEQRPDGELLPPFAMNGAVSTFRIELRPEQNHFDRHTISDFVLRMVFTSRPGGDHAAEASVKARRDLLAQRPHPIMIPLHSACSNAWHAFVDGLSNEAGSNLVLNFEKSHIFRWLQPAERIVQTSIYLAAPDTGVWEPPGFAADLGTYAVPPALKGEPAIHRLQLRRPLTIGEPRTLHFMRSAAKPKRGWLICWVQGQNAS